MLRSGKYFGTLLLAVLMFALLVPLPISAAPSSGHASVGVVVMPERPVATEETRLAITLKDRNQQAIPGASVQVRAEMVMSGMAGMQHGSSSGALTGTAKASDKAGEYFATLKLPSEGDWKITVASGDSVAELKVTAIKAQATTKGGTTSPTSAAVAQGAPAGSSKEAIHAAYLDLAANVPDLNEHVAEWHEGDAESLNVARQKLERVEAVLKSVSWPEDMASAVGQTKAAVDLMARALKDKNAVAAESAAKALGEGYHDLTHGYYADWLPGHTAGAQEDAHSGSGSHEEGSASGPNYYFVSSTLGVVLLTIALVPILRRRDLRVQPVEAD